jgi:hypothetical protein
MKSVEAGVSPAKSSSAADTAATTEEIPGSDVRKDSFLRTRLLEQLALPKLGIEQETARPARYFFSKRGRNAS